MLLVAITFLVSLVMTNDASLLILMPITVEMGMISRKNLLNTVIMQIIAANVGSMLAPFGNPQNIIIFLRYYRLLYILSRDITCICSINPSSFYIYILFYKIRKIKNKL